MNIMCRSKCIGITQACFFGIMYGSLVSFGTYYLLIDFNDVTYPPGWFYILIYLICECCHGIYIYFSIPSYTLATNVNKMIFYTASVSFYYTVFVIWGGIVLFTGDIDVYYYDYTVFLFVLQFCLSTLYIVCLTILITRKYCIDTTETHRLLLEA